MRRNSAQKGLIYAAAAALCAAAQMALFQRIHIAGVLPFLYPLLAVIPATFEEPLYAVTFALWMGMGCDLLLPGNPPCLYTLLFPLAGMLATVFAKLVVPAGVLCSLLVSVMAFALHGAARCALLWLSGHPAWQAGASVALRECLVTLPLCIPLTFLFRYVAEVTREDGRI